MEIYVMRHGRTFWNEQGITQGRTNNELSDFGKEFTKKVAENFKDKKIDVIFTSPLKRTMQTSEIINQYHNVKIVKDERIIEIDEGIFTGTRFIDLTDEEKVLKKAYSQSCNIESPLNVFSRVKDFVNWLKVQPYNSVLVVSHGIIVSYLEHILSNKNAEFVQPLETFDNAEIKHFNLN